MTKKYFNAVTKFVGLDCFILRSKNYVIILPIKIIKS